MKNYSMNSLSEVQKFLVQRLGLSKLQVQIYLLLVQYGGLNVSNIAQKIGKSRAKILKEILIGTKLGIFSRIKKEKEWSISACSFEALKRMAYSKFMFAKQTLSEIEKPTKLLNIFFPLAEQSIKHPITYYEGLISVWSVYLQILNASEIFSFSDIDQYYSIFPQTEEYWDQAFEQNPCRTIFEITPDTPLTRSISSHPLSHKYSYHTQLISPQTFNYSHSDIIAFDDSLALIDLTPNQLHATVIHSPTITNCFKQIHKIAWKQTKE